jgi:PAS domain S-box-containing protein
MSVAEPNVQTILLGDAIERAPAAVFVADENGRYIAANAYACEMLGYDRAELLELNVMDVARYAGAQEEYEELIASRVQAGTSELRRKDGTTFTFAYHAGETTLAGMTYYVAVGWPAE